MAEWTTPNIPSFTMIGPNETILRLVIAFLENADKLTETERHEILKAIKAAVNPLMIGQGEVTTNVR